MTLRDQVVICGWGAACILWCAASDELSGVENPLGIEGRLDGRVGGHTLLADCIAEPPFLGQSNSVFAGDDPPVSQNPGEELVEGSPLRCLWLRFVHP